MAGPEGDFQFGFVPSECRICSNREQILLTLSACKAKSLPGGKVHKDVTRWFAVYCKPRQERTALEHLQRQGFNCLLPMAENPYQRRRSARRSPAEPLFPRYLFLKARPDVQNLAAVRSTRGVVGLVRSGFELVQVPDEVIRALQARMQPDTGLIRLQPAPLGPGDRVLVFDGPLAGVEGILQAHSSAQRAVLLMKLLGRETTVQVDPLLLKRAG